MNCIHCGKKIEWCAITKDYYATNDIDFECDYTCDKSNEGDHEPEPEDAQ